MSSGESFPCDRISTPSRCNQLNIVFIGNPYFLANDTHPMPAA